jgi:hypothetical protein
VNVVSLTSRHLLAIVIACNVRPVNLPVKIYFQTVCSQKKNNDILSYSILFFSILFYSTDEREKILVLYLLLMALYYIFHFKMARDLERERRRVELMKRIHILTRILKLGKPLLFGLFVSGITKQ